MKIINLIKVIFVFLLLLVNSFAEGVSEHSLSKTLPNQLNSEVSQSTNNEAVRIGVLAFRPKPIVEKRWQPLANFLTEQIPHEQFKIIPYNYTELEEAIKNKAIDFVFTNSTHYVQLAFHTKLSSPLATLITQKNSQAMDHFAGTILVKKDNKTIKTLKDIKGKTIATPSIKSFGGFKMQAFELNQINVFLPNEVNILETTMPHDKAIFAVRDNKADVAFVRSGVLENMSQQNLIAIDDFKVINLQKQDNFPYLSSTRLYPEWPIAAMPHVGNQLSSQVVSALFALPHNGSKAKAMNIHGFMIAKDYEPVRNVLRELRVYPFDEASYIRMGDLWKQKSQHIIIAIILVVVIIILFFVNLRTYKKLKLSYVDLENKNEILKLAAVSFEAQEAILITDAEKNIIKVNQAFCKTTGFSANEVIGKKPHLLSSSKHGEDFYKNIWSKLDSDGFWQGETWNQRKNGEKFPIRQTINPIKNMANEITHYVSTFHDISDLKRNQEEIQKLAFYDPLTALANRRLLNDHLKMARAHSERSGLYFALLFIDLDHFKTLNDTLGHDSGDKVLIEVAQRLMECVRSSDTVCRNGGDEFIILLEGLDESNEPSAQKAKLIAEKILNKLKSPIQLEQKDQYISASIGISLYKGHDTSVEEMLVRSDLAMYKAKNSGRNSVQFFDPAMQNALKKQSQLISDMHKALQYDEFELYYQPKVAENNIIKGYEALIRWNHPNHGLLMPGHFIEAAEQSNLITKMGHWVLEEACKQLVIWEKSPVTNTLSIAVNISEKQLRDDLFFENVIKVIKKTKCNPRFLQMEITESLLMKNMEKTIETMQKLKSMGIKFAIDDFGTGYSSLGYLKNLPIDIIKIDYLFVKDMLHSKHDNAIVKIIMTLTQTFNIQAVAEGVETEEQKQHLLNLGCNELQGYLFGKPAPISQLNLPKKTSAR